MNWIARLAGVALLALCGTAHADKIACWYNAQQHFTGADSVPDSTPLGGPTPSGSGDYTWRFVMDAPNGTTCPRPNMPALPTPVAPPAAGDFLVGGGSNGNDCFALLRHPDGHISQILDPYNFRFPDGAIAAITDARLLAATEAWAMVVHNDGSVSRFGPLAPKVAHVNPDIIYISSILMALHQDGSTTDILSKGPFGAPYATIDWKNVAALTNDGKYSLTKDGKILGDKSDRGYPVFSKITTARAVASNIHQGVALLADGTLVAWDTAFGPPSNRDAYNLPHPPAGLTGITAIAAGIFVVSTALFAVQERRAADPMLELALWAWQKRDTQPPAGLSGVTAIAAGSGCSLAAALKSDGSLTSWHIIL